jgi:iron(III) transport system substrate-binding protein
MTTGRITAVAIVAAALASAGDATAQSSTTGAVTVYTAGPKNLADALAKGFTAKTHARVNLFQATTGKIMARLAAEQADPQCDVLISAAWETAVAMKAKGQLLAYETPNAAKVPAMLKDGAYVAQGAAALAIIWNAKSGKPKPRDWSDLAMASYKDAVTMPDPAASGSAFGLVSGLAANQGFGWKFFRTLKSNGAFVAGANAAALNPVMQGAKAAVFGGVDYISLGARAKGEAIDVIYPASGTVLEARPMMILKSTKNAALAKRFIDYALSEDGQKLVANVYLLPARTDVAARRPGWKDIKLLPEQAENAAGRARTLAQFKTVMGIK